MIAGAKADYFNAMQAARYSDFKAGKYSMTEFLKYSGGDPDITARYMAERGLSMDAPVGSMSIGAEKVQKGGVLIFGKESVPVYQTYMENKMTGGDFSQTEQLEQLKKEDPAAYARLEEQARRQAGDVNSCNVQVVMNLFKFKALFSQQYTQEGGLIDDRYLQSIIIIYVTHYHANQIAHDRSTRLFVM